VICGDILEWWRSSERFARCWFVHNKGTSLGLMVVITIVHWGYKATNRTGGGHHLVNGETTRDDNLVEWEHVDHILTMAHTLNAMDFPPEGPFRTLLLLLLGPHFDSSPGALSVWQHLTTFVGKGWLSTGSQRQHPPEVRAGTFWSLVLNCEEDNYCWTPCSGNLYFAHLSGSGLQQMGLSENWVHLKFTGLS
jgi:hypothetical protein